MSQPIQRVGQYNFLKKLGTGRMAEVYLGRIEGAEGFQKPVAIKKILPHLSSDLQFVQSLIAEARVGGQLHHRNIVEVYDFIRYGNDYCIIMEYVDGVDLGRILRSSRRYRVRIPPAAALYIASHICDGLDYAHSARGFNGEPLNIIHRDLKPSNILISIKGGVKISDFGIARVMEQAVQRSPGDVKISYQYQSPEQATGRTRLTAASDIFSVGVILFEMLTLEPLFPGKNVIQVLEGLREADFSKRLALAQRQLPGSEKILATALNPDPEQRYRTARMMAEDIRRLLLYLKVDDPRERLVTFFARLVRFVQEQGKRPPEKRSEAGSGGVREDVEPKSEQVSGKEGSGEGDVATIRHEEGGGSSVGGEVAGPEERLEQGGREQTVPTPQAPPPPGEASTHSPEIPGPSLEDGGGASPEVPSSVEEEAQPAAAAELEMPMGTDYATEPPAPAQYESGESAGGGAETAALSWEQGGEATAVPSSVQAGTPAPPEAGTPQLPPDFNPEETRIGTYATVQQELPSQTPTTQLAPDAAAPDDSTRILPAGEVPPPPAPASEAKPAGASAAFDETVDSGDGTALLPMPPQTTPARPGGRRRLLLLGAGMVAVLAVGGGGLAYWQHVRSTDEVVDSAHKRCPICGHVLPADAAFCGFCGANLEKDGQQSGQEAIVKCPYCGADNDPDAAFCGNCGKKLPNH